MTCETVIIKEQSAWKTWTTPDLAMPVDDVSVDVGQDYITRRATGSCRGLKYAWRGQKMVTGSMEMMAFYEYLGWFLKSALMHNVSSNVLGVTSAYEHGFFPKDDTMPSGLSVQVQRDGTKAQNLIGLIFDTMTFACAANEPLMISGDWMAFDEAPTGGNWNDGTSAPAYIASPTSFADSILPYRFEHASLTYGGTLTYDGSANKYTIAGGTASAVVESAEISLENNADARPFLGNRTAGNITNGDRAVGVRMDVDQSTVDETFYNLYRDGTESTLLIEFDSGVEADTGENYKLTFVVPRIILPSGSLPDVSGSNDRRMQSVEATGLVDTNGRDFNVFLTDTATAY